MPENSTEPWRRRLPRKLRRCNPCEKLERQRFQNMKIWISISMLQPGRCRTRLFSPTGKRSKFECERQRNGTASRPDAIFFLVEKRNENGLRLTEWDMLSLKIDWIASTGVIVASYTFVRQTNNESLSHVRWTQDAGIRHQQQQQRILFNQWIYRKYISQHFICSLSTRSLEGRINQMSDRTCKDVCLGSDCYKLQVTAVAIDKSK